MQNRSEKNSEVFRRTRRMMLLLPVILVPLMAIGFYALGGGRGDKSGKSLTLTKGLNMSLPEAKIDAKKNGLNKLGFYKQSEEDSMRLREKRKMDPYYGMKDSAPAVGLAGDVRPPGHLLEGGLNAGQGSTDAQAGELLGKLDLLRGVLSRQERGGIPEPPAPVPGRPSFPTAGMAAVSAVPYAGAPVASGPGDPDLDKLNTLMDKVLRVRYPGDPPVGDVLMHDTVSAVRGERPVQALTVAGQEEVVTTLPEEGEDLQTGFIELGEEQRGDSVAETMIAAVVDGAQSLISGEAVGFRTVGDAMLGGSKVPRGAALSGRAMVSGERLMVSVNAVRLGARVIPVSLEVVDMDGMVGIRVKGSINRDVSKESASEAVGSLGVTSLDSGVAGQAAAAGIQAAKNLFSRKIRLVRVGLPAGYKVLLRNRAR